MSENKGLSEREREILQLVATGASNKEISRQLTISENTTKVHLRNIFSKLGVSSRTEATLHAIREGLVENPAETAASGPNAISGKSVSALPAPEAVGPEHISAPAWVQQPARWWRIAVVGAVVVTLSIIVGLVTSFDRPATSTSASPAPAVSNRWKTRAALTAPRRDFAATAFENKIYAIAGESDGKIVGAVERYDPDTDTWESLASKPTAVADVSAVAVHGRIYVPGGRLGSGEVTNVLEAYAPSENSWELRAPLPRALSAYALAAFEGKIYVFGGWDGTRFVAAAYEYDPDQDVWRERVAMPTARGFAGVAVAGGRMFVIGGYDGKQTLAVNEQYASDRDAWTSRQPLPAPRFAMGAASIADFVYVMGGENAPLAPLQYLYQQDKWQELDSPVLQAWSHFAVVPVQTQLYIMGGQLGKGVTLQNLAYQAIYTVIFPIRP